MALQNATILDGGTCSATGGTSKTFTPDGVPVTRGIHLIDASVTDFRIRPQMSVAVKQPTLNSDGSWSKGRKTLTLVIPKILASGAQVFPLVRVEFEDHPEMSTTEQTRLLGIAAQALFDTDFANLWSVGSLA